MMEAQGPLLKLEAMEAYSHLLQLLQRQTQAAGAAGW